MTSFFPEDRLDILARKFHIGPYARLQKEDPKKEEDSSATREFSIDDGLGDRFVIKNIPFKDAFYTLQWSEELIDGGQSRTQDEWKDFLQQSEWKLPDAPLYHATLAALYAHKDGLQSELVEKVRNTFSKHFKERWLVTGSWVVYEPQGNDTVKHALLGAEKQAMVVGPDGWVNARCGFEDSMNALLCTCELAEVEKVYEWVSGKKPYLWRINNKKNVNAERAVVLGVYLDRFVIDAYVIISAVGPLSGWSSARRKLHRK
ncbi:MAG: hypothetical protein HY363_05155 [Candidatus Aenigmarchaeota archaeon]|nr:hypothetical protein [Candidatus Aenigmarchaeota archaeon]